MPNDNTLVSGDWWQAGDERAMVSLEDDYAEDLGLSIGDVMTFDIAGEILDVEPRVPTTVSSLRTFSSIAIGSWAPGTAAGSGASE